MNAAPHLFWITSRAAGGAALLLASASVGLGLMMSSSRGRLSKRDLRSLHETLSLATLAMVALHGLALLGDSFLDPGLTGVAVPLASAYRPLWTGLGIIAGYGIAALGLSYYLRDRIGAARWRRVHRLTAAFWMLAAVHTIGAGSDAAQPWFLIASGALVLPAALLLALRWLPVNVPNSSPRRLALASLIHSTPRCVSEDRDDQGNSDAIPRPAAGTEL